MCVYVCLFVYTFVLGSANLLFQLGYAVLMKSKKPEIH